jgi:uncharacterized membrane protein
MAHIFYTASKTNLLMAKLTANVGAEERVLSILAGAWLLYRNTTNKKVSLFQTISGTYLLLRGLTGFCLAYDRLGKKQVDFRAPNINIRTSLRVNRPRDQVYASWRRLENLPKFMRHLKNVEVLDNIHSEWTAAFPGEFGAVSWKSEIVKDDPGATLSWHSLPGSTIENAGKITFADDGNGGTILHVVFSYHAPMGVVGEKAGRLIHPMLKDIVIEDIRNFKRYIERKVPAPAS